ncbi:MAG TPA: 2OG-Fe(II) oxygenase [Povalibacter sp.]|uniref:2OG-Fe(II) oxygenase n=1 Tax=Povalibacter sp. TaxID=1962978 RepID=UPI002B78F531|nr:2OG-Fe(II) oxygenase [Povalibacter sp.]HMN45745.1 2OG-Fe(II) oxygenase [Povalibacter sp.]
MKSNVASLQDYFGQSLDVPRDVDVLRERYRSAQPFPHVVVDNLFAAAFLDRLVAEAPPPEAEQWQTFEREDLERTYRMRSAMDVGSAGSEMVALMHSAAFLYLLSEITGVWQLLPDPYLQGAGHAMMRRGDFFKVHADRNVAYDTGLTRRLVVIVFLNRHWRPEYRGQLELWNHAGERCEVSIEPEFNRTVIFEVAYPNYHGVPQPLECPADRMRRSFLVYYHTAHGGAGDRITPHSSRFAPAFYRRRKSALRRAAEQITPPIVLNAVRRLIKGPV